MRKLLLKAAPLFAALGDPTRLRLVAMLCEYGPLSIVRLTEGTDISRQGVAKHLRILEQTGLVRSGRSGRERIWRLENKPFSDVRRHLDQISEQWDAAVRRLQEFVEAKRH